MIGVEETEQVDVVDLTGYLEERTSLRHGHRDIFTASIWTR